jgi:hypothetical protein
LAVLQLYRKTSIQGVPTTTQHPQKIAQKITHLNVTRSWAAPEMQAAFFVFEPFNLRAEQLRERVTRSSDHRPILRTALNPQQCYVAVYRVFRV